MAADILLELKRQSALPETYMILELSAELCQRQRDTLTERAPELVSRVQWIDALPEEFVGVVLANEVLDAMPVECFRRKVKGVEQMIVGYERGGMYRDYRAADAGGVRGGREHRATP